MSLSVQLTGFDDSRQQQLLKIRGWIKTPGTLGN
jgi:hypothetical protein